MRLSRRSSCVEQGGRTTGPTDDPRSSHRAHSLRSLASSPRKPTRLPAARELAAVSPGGRRGHARGGSETPPAGLLRGQIYTLFDDRRPPNTVEPKGDREPGASMVAGTGSTVDPVSSVDGTPGTSGERPRRPRSPPEHPPARVGGGD